MNIAGETLTAWARVKSTTRESAWGLVELEIGIRNEKGAESTPGSATIALPYENGQPLPYPFKS